MDELKYWAGMGDFPDWERDGQEFESLSEAIAFLEDGMIKGHDEGRVVFREANADITILVNIGMQWEVHSRP